MMFDISVLLSPISGFVRWDIGHGDRGKYKFCWRHCAIDRYTKSFIHWQHIHSLSHVSLFPHGQIYLSSLVLLDLCCLTVINLPHIQRFLLRVPTTVRVDRITASLIVQLIIGEICRIRYYQFWFLP